MKRKRRSLAWLLAAVLFVVSGSLAAFAAGETTALSETEEADEGEAIDIGEEQEEMDATPADITAYFSEVGQADGYSVWLRPENYKDVIEAKQPDVDAADDTKKRLRNVELALLDQAGELVAELEKAGSSKEETVCLSHAGRYLVVLNADRDKVLRIRYRVSTLDSAFLFLTQDKKTLELYSTDYESLRAVMQLDETKDGQCIYRSADGGYQAFLNAEKDQAWACVRQAAENDKLVLYYEEDTAVIALENKANGYLWWSSPLGCDRDTRAKALTVAELGSSAVLTYGDRNAGSTAIQRSRNGSEVKCRETGDGLEITYDFGKSGILVPVTYTLCDDYLSVSVETAAIRESRTEEGITATELELLGSFGAGTADEEGYFVIPDGCGALLRFNNGKTDTKSYSAKVYGRDITAVPTTKPAVTEKIYMPVYGIVKEGNAMTVIVEKGDGNVFLNASVSGQSLSSYNICSFSFQLRGSDTFYMAGDYGDLTVFEKGETQQDELKLRYYPTADETASYMDIAETYRTYLLNDGGVTAKAESDRTELYLDLYGGTMRPRSVLGIPVTLKTAVTGFDEARTIVQGFTDRGITDVAVIYHNWTDEGISGKVDNKAKPSGTLGGNGAFRRMTDLFTEQGIAFYPAVNNVVFQSGNGYYPFFHTAIRISGAYARQIPYDLAYGVQDTSQKTKSLLSPGTFAGIYSKLAKRYAQKGLTGVSLGEMTASLWSDHGKQNMGCDSTMRTLQESYQQIRDAGLSLLADGCAAYAFPYVDRITEVPLQSSGFDVLNEDIPFYQIVMHGVIPYAGTAINASADAPEAFLNCIATGCDPSYDMIYAEASELKDTELDRYFYADHAFWTDTAAEEYELAKEILSGVSDQYITDYVRDGDISVTTYADGTEITVDYAEETITAGGKTWVLEEVLKGA